MYRLAQIYEEAKYDLHDLLRLHRIAKALGMEKRDIINVFDLIKHNQLETLQWKVRYLRSEIDRLMWEKRNSMYHLSNLERTINGYEETLTQKRAEMAYLNRESRKIRQRIVEYNTNNLYPIVHPEPDTNSHSTQIVPYDKK
jgi:chromosome segregation ATPase